MLGKISGVFLAIPNPVLGGVTTFLFASVAVSGVRVLSYIRFTRRDRFVLAAALSFGFGDLLVPGIFTHLFDRVENRSKGLQGLFDSITIVLSTPCKYLLNSKKAVTLNFKQNYLVLSSGIVAAILNLVLPQEVEHDAEQQSQEASPDIESDTYK